MATVFADIRVKGRLEPLGGVRFASRSGHEPATHCFVEVGATVEIYEGDGLARFFQANPQAVLKDSGLKEIGSIPETVTITAIPEPVTNTTTATGWTTVVPDEPTAGTTEPKTWRERLRAWWQAQFV